MVRDIRTGSASSAPYDLTNVSGRLYFAADNGVNGRELWKSSGTASGTVVVHDIRTGAASSFPSGLTNVNGVLYFVTEAVESGYELWKSNGTSAGTLLVKSFPASAGFGYPDHLVNVNGTLYFNGEDSSHGDEVWISNGTAAGTLPVNDIAPGRGSSHPVGFIVSGSRLFVGAVTDTVGRELFALDLSASASIAAVTSSFSNASGQSPSGIVNSRVTGPLPFEDRMQTGRLSVDVADSQNTTNTNQPSGDGAGELRRSFSVLQRFAERSHRQINPAFESEVSFQLTPQLLDHAFETAERDDLFDLF